MIGLYLWCCCFYETFLTQCVQNIEKNLEDENFDDKNVEDTVYLCTLLEFFLITNTTKYNQLSQIK